MNYSWPAGICGEGGPGACETNAIGDGRFDLSFIRHGKRTLIDRQFVSYPFHMTRAFALDDLIPDLLTVYQQSSSGGFYRGERLTSSYSVGPRAAAHVTTQAATVVHDCHGQPASQTVTVQLEEDAFLALVPDPLILFPGASYINRVEASLATGATLLLADVFAYHDPKGLRRPFEALASDVVVRGGGRLQVRDCMRIRGADLMDSASPAGRWRVVSSFLLMGSPGRLPSKDTLDGMLADTDAVIGISALANDAGWGVRCLTADAVSARRVADRIFSISVCAALGSVPAPRRK